MKDCPNTVQVFGPITSVRVPWGVAQRMVRAAVASVNDDGRSLTLRPGESFDSARRAADGLLGSNLIPSTR